MDAPRLDFSQADQVLKELFDDDRWIKDKFAECLAVDLTILAERLAAAFAAFAKLDRIAGQGEQNALVAGFVFGVIDDLLVSTKILITGKLMPSGNLMRQAVEGIAAAVLCASKDLVIIKVTKNTNTTARYWELAKGGDRRVRSHMAVEQLSMNQPTLRVSADAVEQLKRAREHYHRFSHPGVLGIAARVALGPEGQVYAGGHFDEAKLDAYKIEIAERSELCGILPPLIDSLIARLTG